MVKFGEIEIIGFGSIVNKTVFNLDQQGLNLIRGKVGSGKTTIPSALTWVLYGQTLKGTKSSVLTWEELRPENYAGCKVALNFKIGKIQYKVIRCKDFKRQIRIGELKTKGANKLIFLQDGEPIHSEKGKALLQREIEKTLGYTFELFKNSIVFGQKMKRIIEETGPNKKKVFEEAFEATFIKQAADNVLEEVKELENILSELRYQEDKHSDKLLSKKETLKEVQSLISNSETLVKNYKRQLKEIEKEITENQEMEKVDISKLTNKYHKVVKKIDEGKQHNATIDRAKSKLEDIQTGIEELEELLNRKGKKCHTCGSTLELDRLKAMRDKLNKDLNSLRKQASEYREVTKLEYQDLTDLENKAQNIKIEIRDKQKYNDDITRKKQTNVKLKKTAGEIKDTLAELNVKRNRKKEKELEKEIELILRTVKTNSKKIKKLDRTVEIKKWLLKDPLSNNGLKAYMFNELLMDVNKQLIKYSDILGFLIEFGIDLSTRNKDFYQVIMLDNILIPYDDLSGGQKQLVDTSVAFAIHDVVSSLKPSNVVFLDEPFESLGSDEIEVIAELVEEKAKDKSLYLITHHISFAPHNANEIIVTRDENKNTIISSVPQNVLS